MPWLPIAAGLGAVAGGILPAALGVGKNKFTAQSFGDSKQYDPNAQYMGSDPEMANRMAGEYAGLAQGADARGFLQGDYGMANMSRDQQMNALHMQQLAAEGNMPSVAAQQMSQGNAQAMRNQLAMASGARGAGAMGAAQFQAAQGLGNLQAQNIANTGQLRAQEMAQARDAYMGGASGMRGMDIGQANAIAQQQLMSRGQNDARSMGMYGMRNGVLDAQMQARMQNQGMLANSMGQANQINSGIAGQNAARDTDYWNGGMKGAMGGLQMGAMMGGGGGGGGSTGGQPA